MNPNSQKLALKTQKIAYYLRLKQQMCGDLQEVTLCAPICSQFEKISCGICPSATVADFLLINLKDPVEALGGFPIKIETEISMLISQSLAIFIV